MEAATLTHSSSPAAPLASQDLALVERHRVGDARAFEEIYRRYDQMVYALALRLCAEPEQAADLTQEVFLRVFQNIHHFRGLSSLKTWIFRIAINHCRRSLGRRRFHWLSLFEEPSGEPGLVGLTLADPQRGPEDLAVASDESRRVTAALARLPLHFREAIILRDLEGLPYEEIAEILGIRIGTVRSRIARGREQLRSLLEVP